MSIVKNRNKANRTNVGGNLRVYCYGLFQYSETKMSALSYPSTLPSKSWALC